MTDDTLLGGMRDGAWLDAQDFPPLEYAVPGIIPEGFGLCVAPPKAGKSWLVAGVGLGCAAGGLVLGRIRIERRRPVCYWALEDGHRRLQARFRHLMLGEAIPAGINVITQATTALIVPMMSEFLLAHADEAPLLILDTLGRVKPPKPPGSEAYQADYAIGAQLKACIDSVQGASLLVVHHTRKQESSDFVDDVSGTAGIAGSADFLLRLSRPRHSDEALLSVTGRDIAEAEYALRSENGLWTLDGDDLASAAQIADQRRLTSKRSDRTVEIASVVTASVTPVTSADIGDKLGLSKDIAGRYLRRLAEDGVIEKAGRGLYKSVSVVSEPKISTDQVAQTTTLLSETLSEAVSESSSEIRTTDTTDTDREGAERRKQIIAAKLAELGQ